MIFCASQSFKVLALLFTCDLSFVQTNAQWMSLLSKTTSYPIVVMISLYTEE